MGDLNSTLQSLARNDFVYKLPEGWKILHKGQNELERCRRLIA